MVLKFIYLLEWGAQWSGAILGSPLQDVRFELACLTLTIKGIAVLVPFLQKAWCPFCIENTSLGE
jgi:hypothetical protein